MDIKDQVLAALERSKGQFVSGSELAEKLFVSRNAVWKAVAALRDRGHAIMAVTNKGYRLDEDSAILSTASIEKHLGQLCDNFSIEVYPELSSTNVALKERAAAGAIEGVVIVADRQTGGRGRLGRSFYSPAGTGIYMSLLLRPKCKAEEATMLTAAAAVAVAEAIEDVAGIDAEIKWVNDVYCRGRKVCGILTEGTFDMESGGMEYVVVGIGVNVSEPEDGFPQELADRAGALFTGTVPVSDIRSRLIADILIRFRPYYERLAERLFIKKYQARSFVVGQEVDVIAGNSTRRARALRVDDSCRLAVRYDDGTEETLSSGEVSIRPHVT